MRKTLDSQCNRSAGPVELEADFTGPTGLGALLLRLNSARLVFGCPLSVPRPASLFTCFRTEGLQILQVYPEKKINGGFSSLLPLARRVVLLLRRRPKLTHSASPQSSLQNPSEMASVSTPYSCPTSHRVQRLLQPIGDRNEFRR